MKRVVEIASRFREVIFSGTWIANTNFMHQLKDLDWKIATAKIDSLNTIALLAQHIHYYIAGVANVLVGGNCEISDKYSFSFPPITSQDEWVSFLNRFFHDAEEFARLVEQMPEERMEDKFVDAIRYLRTQHQWND